MRHLRRVGGDIEVHDGSLQVTAPAGVLTDALKQELAGHKAELVALVREAVQMLNERGARLIVRGGQHVIGVWKDADSRELREALEVVGYGEAPVFYLDDPTAGIPERYRHFMPDYVKAIWTRKGLLATPSQRLEAAVKAQRLNRILDTYGAASGHSGVTADTVLHGMLHNGGE